MNRRLLAWMTPTVLLLAAGAFASLWSGWEALCAWAFGADVSAMTAKFLLFLIGMAAATSAQYALERSFLWHYRAATGLELSSIDDLLSHQGTVLSEVAALVGHDGAADTRLPGLVKTALEQNAALRRRVEDSGHYALPAERRAMVVRKYYEDKSKGLVENQDAWAQTNAQVSGRTLRNWLREAEGPPET